MNPKIKILKNVLGDLRVKENFDLSEVSVTKLGGQAEIYFIATSSAELTSAIELCRELEIDFLLIGSGSKVVLAKEGFKGLVIKNRSDLIKIAGIKGKASKLGVGVEEVLIEAGSGVSLKKLAQFVTFQKLAGLEGLSDTLGTIGGSLSINLILRSKITQVKVLSKVNQILQKQLGEVLKDDIILSVILKLKIKKLS